MSFRNVLVTLSLSAALAACGGSSGGEKADLSSEPDLALPPNDLNGAPSTDLAFGDGSVVLPTGSNVVPFVVDNGPAAGQGSANVGFITIKLCTPGTTTCTTIDHVSVDTGSVGLRVLSSVLPTAMLTGTGALPVTKDASGNSVGECYNYADGYVWGSVRTADFTVGSETALAMPFHVIGDTSIGAVPALCPEESGETAEDTLDTFGSNAIIGIAPYAPDCDFCTTAPPANETQGWMYWGCTTAGACTAIGLDQAKQLSNPVSLFATDNNGVILTLPDPGDAPAATLTGALTFGIGTQANNALSSTATMFKIADMDADQGQDYLDIPSSTIAGKSCTPAFFDSGTNFVSFDDARDLPAADQCKGNDEGFYCPPAPVGVSCANLDASKTAHPFTYDVGNADTIFNMASQTDSVFKAVVGEAGGSGCDWGLPFFYGKKLYVGIEGATVTGATTPFEAY